MARNQVKRPTEITCEQCGKPAPVGKRGPIPKICRNCARQVFLPEPKICKNCDEEFTPTHPRQAYCSYICQLEYNRSKRATRLCYHCGTNVTKGDFCSPEHKQATEQPTCITQLQEGPCGFPGARPHTDGNIRMNYQFCSPLHRHWHWCDRNNIPRNDDVPQKVDQTFTNLNLPVKRTPKDEALPPEVQLAMVRLLGMSMDTARTKTMNSLNEHVYIGLVRTICKHTKEQFNDYAWPIQATNKIITMHLNNEFDLGPTAHRQTKSNFEANMLQLDQYLTWLQDQNKPYRPTVSSLTLAKSKQSEPQRKTPGTIKPPQIKRINKTILNTFQTVEDYKQAIPTHMQNPDDIKYIATRSKK